VSLQRAGCRVLDKICIICLFQPLSTHGPPDGGAPAKSMRHWPRRRRSQAKSMQHCLQRCRGVRHTAAFRRFDGAAGSLREKLFPCFRFARLFFFHVQGVRPVLSRVFFHWEQNLSKRIRRRVLPFEWGLEFSPVMPGRRIRDYI